MFMKSDRFEKFKKFSVVPEAVIGIIAILVIWKISRIRFETNDDFIIQGLTSGLFTGGKGVHWIFRYNHYLLNVILAFLYKLFPVIPWYGILLALVHFLCYLFSVNSLCSKAKNIAEYLCINAAFSAIFWWWGWYLHARIQYTSTAEIAAILGCVCFAFCENKKLKVVYIVLLEVLAFALRPNAMLLMIPMGLVMILFSVDSQTKLFSREGLKKPAPGVICLFVVAAIGELSMVLPKIDGELRAADSSNEARVQMFDYSGAPTYEEISDLLDENITKEKYDAFDQYLVLDWDCSDGSLQRVAEYSKEKTVNPGVAEVIRSSFDILFRNEFCKISSVLLPLLLIAVLAVILSKRFWMFAQVVVFHLVIGACLGYLVFNGRIPERVIYPIIFSEAVFLMCVVVKVLSENEEKRVLRIMKMITIIAMAVIVLFLSVRTAKEQYRYLKEKMQSETLLNEQFRQVEKYCNEDPQSLYIVSHEFYMYTHLSAFDNIQSGNYIFSGGWYSLLPETLEYVDDYLSRDKDCFFIITEDTQDFVRKEKLDYLAQYFGSEPEETGRFSTATGGNCIVYCVRKNTGS